MKPRQQQGRSQQRTSRKSRKGNKSALVANRAFAPLLGLWGLALGALVVLVLPASMVEAATRGLMIGHVAPEAVKGGPIAAIRDGDTITIEIESRKLEVDLSDEVIAERIAAYRSPEPAYTRGVMAKYADAVSSASLGAIT